ncbi:hypothetical protein [Ramlibacter sp.]|uniref:hypothetical protein n=1 Tax=Ramlibacter sp. TaxID=1917967 RepID=UPI003D0BA896
MPEDLHATRERLRGRASTAAAELERSIDAAQAPACRHAFLKTHFEAARAVASSPAVASMPLGGLAVSVKCLFH